MLRRAISRLCVAAVVAGALVPLAAGTANAALTPLVPGGVAVVTGDGVGDGAAATGAKVDGVRALAYAPDGDLVVAELKRLRRIDATTGVITTLAATTAFTQVEGVTVGPDGTVYAADWLGGVVRAVAPDGTVTTVAGGGSTTPANGVVATAASLLPRSVAVSPGGVLYIGQRGAVWRVDAGLLTRVAGTGTVPGGVPGGDGGEAQSAGVANVDDIAFTASGDLLFSDSGMGTVRRVAGAAPTGTIDTVGGNANGGNPPADGALATTGRLNGVHDLGVAPDGTVLFTAQYLGVRRLTIGGTVTTVDQGPGDAACGFAMAVDATGGIVAACTGAYATVRALPGDGTTTLVAGSARAADGTAAADAFYRDLRTTARAADGTVYLLDGYEIRSIGTDGLLHTVAGTGVRTIGGTGDGGPALAATFDQPRAIAVAPDGTLYVADGSFVRKVVPGGDITAFAGKTTNVQPADGLAATEVFLGEIKALAADSTGAVYIAGGYGCSAIRVTTDGLVHPQAAPGCSGTMYGADMTVDGADRLVYVRNSSVGYAELYRADGAGVAHLVDRGPHGGGVAVTPSGSVETLRASLRPDGSRLNQQYEYAGYEVPYDAHLVAEPAGTLLASDGRRLLRLTPAAQTLAPAVTGLVVTPGPGTLALSWDASASTDLMNVRIRIQPGTEAPTIAVGTDVIVSPNEHAITLYRGNDPDAPGEFPGLNGGQPYSVSVYAESPGGLSVSVTATATPTADTTPPANVGGLTATYANGKITASWTRPADPDLYSIEPRLGTGAAPATRTDGTNAYGPLSGGTFATWYVGDGTYYVRVFALDVSGNVAAGPPTSLPIVVDKTAPAQVTGLTLGLSGDDVVATWATPAADVAHVTARILTGSTYPATTNDGTPAASSTATSAQWGSAQLGVPYRVSIFTTDANGNTGAPATATFVPRRPATLLAGVSKAVVAYGGRVTVSGTLRRAGTTTPLAGERVELWSRRRATGSFAFGGFATTNALGHVTFTPQPGLDSEYQLRHPDSTVAAATSAAKAVGVAAVVDSALSATTVRRGTTVTLSGTVKPKHVHVPVTLQRYYGGTWHYVGTLWTDGSSRVKVALRPTAPGTYAYRLLFAGDAEHRAGTSDTRTLRVT
jgi:hypothetical protein